MSSRKVSVIIPVYNVELYLEECLESVFLQDYTNIEVVAVNDGSTDSSLKILETFKSKYPELIVITIDNQGQSVARNTGIEMSTGDFIFFMDSDDWIEKNTISRCMNEMDVNKVDMVFFAAAAFCDGVDESYLKNFNYRRSPELLDKVFKSHEFFRLAVLLGNYIVSPCLYLYKKNKLSGVRFYPGIIHEDNLFTTEILLADSTTEVVCIDDQLFHRRIRRGSTMTQRKIEAHVIGYITVAENLVTLGKGEGEGSKKALSFFIQDILLNALSVVTAVYRSNIPWVLRKRILSLLFRLDLRFIRLKTVVCCVAPELMGLKKRLGMGRA